MVTVADLVEIRSSLILDVLGYLDEVAKLAAEVPDYYPAHLRSLERGVTAFDGIHQTVKLVTDRKEFGRWRAEEMERLRRAGVGAERLAYAPRSGTPEADDRDWRATSIRKVVQTVVWDERATARFPRAIVLGDPGFGKSWLLRYEARRLARHAAMQLRERTTLVDQIVVPVRLHLSDLHRTKGSIKDAVVNLICEGRSERFWELVKSKVGTADTVLLMDGWDEVTKRRAELRERLRKFARDFPAQTVLVASRIVGYDASPIPGASELELLSFNRREAESFVRVWFQDQRDGRAEGLLTLVDQNQTLRGLARIPLMLALMCRVYEAREKAFPERRGQLYERCLWGLLRDWKQVRGKAPEDVVIEATLDRLRVGAFRLLRDGREQFTETELAEALGFDWKKQPRQAQNFVDRLKAHGLLIAADQDGSELLFLHRTFQEHLAACWLAEQDWEETKPLICRKSWLPQWREVVILLAGQFGERAAKKVDATELRGLISLLANKSEDDFFRNRLGLAGMCIAEVPLDVRNRCSDILDPVTSDCFSIYWTALNQNTESAHHAVECTLPALGQMGGLSRGRPISLVLCEQLSWNVVKDSRVRYLAAQALGQLGEQAAYSAEAVRALVTALHDPDSYVRCSAARSLANFGGTTVRDSKAIATLLKSLRDAPDTIESSSIASALARLMVRTGSYPTPLLKALRDTDKLVRGSSAAALTSMGEATPLYDKSIAVLLGTLRDSSLSDEENDEGYFVRQNAAEALGKLGETLLRYPNVIPALVDSLHDADLIVKTAAAAALGELGELAARNPKVIPGLLEHLRDTEDVELVRFIAAQALGSLGGFAARHREVIPALIDALGDHDETVRAFSASALGNLGEIAAGQRAVRLIPPLLRCLHDPKSEVRSSAAESLGKLGAALDPAVGREIIQALEVAARDSEWEVAYMAASAVDEIRGEFKARLALAPLLVSAMSESGGRLAADTLGDLQSAGARLFRRGQQWEVQCVDDLGSGQGTKERHRGQANRRLRFPSARPSHKGHSGP